MTPKELIDKITLAAEQLESLRTEHDLPISIGLGEEVVYLVLANKRQSIQITLSDSVYHSFERSIGGRTKFYDTYEELVEDNR